MSNSSFITTFVARRSDSAGGLDIWAALEQEAIPRSAREATLNEAFQMVARARSGKSAMEYIYDSCPYGRIKDGVLTVTLDFYVWVSSMDLAYSLKAGRGTISPAMLFDRPRSFDVIFNNSSSENLGFLFDGSFVPEMPFFNATGQIIPDPAITISGSNVQLSEQATGVLRANCTAHGYRHTLKMELEKTTVLNTNPDTGIETELFGYALDQLQTDITVMWTDGGGKSQSSVLAVQIPGCIEDMITACNGERLIERSKQDDDLPNYLVYYSTCNGEILKEFWEPLK